MSALTLARQSGYLGDSPAMLEAFERIRQSGIRQARAGHFERKRIVDQMKAEPGMFFAAIRPSLCTAEAIEDAKRFLAFYRNMPNWRQQNRAGDLRRAKQTMVLARYFRRFGRQLWVREAA
ncbi:hypothetical protein [Mesorhizobium sp. B2-3-2]|uniref:hypothetical protein n=1 Tax=Mesorhizobium sp. B2-3-2 TaxID=2589961 RepID=UPI001127F46F|nr:hypothetical protein [Mesorhizobium sp. B2-3-2]TPM37025.1 hypothetical protein FJ964_30275 [Mesorhizobium sp. B2-3-2]